MKRIVYELIIIAVLCFLQIGSKAQSIPIFYKQYNSSNGLKANNITHITSDSIGYIWIATTNGLIRFDGSKFLEYSNEKNQLPSNNVMRLSANSGGQLWASCYPYGIAKFDEKSQKFIDFSYAKNKKLNHFFSFRYKDKKNRIWMATMDENNTNEQGLYLCNQNSIPIKKYTFSASDEVHSRFNYNKITNYYARKNGEIWLSSWKGIVLFNPLSEIYTTYDLPKNKANIECLKMCITEDDDENVWVGSWGFGLLMFNYKTKVWEEYKYIEEKIPTGVKNIIYSIASKNKNELWIASNHGLLVFNKKEKQFHKVTGPDGADQITGSVINTLFKDASGNLWAGTATKGLVYIPTVQFKVNYVPIKNTLNIEGKAGGSKIIYDKELDCYIRLSLYCGIIYIYDRKTLNEKRIDAHVNSLISFINFFDAIKLEKGKYLLLENNDFYILDILKGTLESARAINYKVPWREGQSLFLCKFLNNEIAMLHPKGLLLFDPISKSEREFLFQTRDKAVYHHCYDYYIKGNKIWILSDEKKCYCYELINYQLVQRYQFDMKSAQGFKDIIAVGDHDLYASDFIHLYHIKLSDNQKPIANVILTPPAGIPFQNLDKLYLIDSELWVSNLLSVLKFDLKTKEFASINEEEYILANDFHVSPIVELNQVAIAFDNGFLLLNKNDYPWTQNHKTPLVINQLMVHNKPYLEGDITHLKEIELNYQQNFISVDFSALIFDQSPQAKYEYMLEGIDASWNKTNKDHKALYTSLPPGTYTLKFKAQDKGFGWQSVQRSLMITITPPFWQTWWFILLCLCLLGVAIYLIFRWRFNQVRNEEKLKSDFEKKVAETEMRALRAQMNPHFIFNCLNSINGYIVKNDPFSASDYLSKFSKLIRLILDNSRQSKIPLQNEIEAIQIYIEMESLRFSNQFKYHIQIDELIDSYMTQ
ncbi:MAG: histidine kinase, partial [Bacteroidetes bacterium]|nr:histidine kinase [Bacteroidota bacterium]